MRRALVVLAVLVVVTGAFTVGVLFFRGGGDDDNRHVVESQLHCGESDPNGECSDRVDREVSAVCDEGVDAVRFTVVFETDEGREYARRNPDAGLLGDEAPFRLLVEARHGERTLGGEPAPRAIGRLATRPTDRGGRVRSVP